MCCYAGAADGSKHPFVSMPVQLVKASVVSDGLLRILLKISRGTEENIFSQ